MANKLYEEESIRAIADAIRQSAPDLVGNRTFKVEEMADAISNEVCDEQYDIGHSDGYIDGYDDGYEVGFGAGSVGGVVDPTTVWEINNSPYYGALPSSPISVNFNSAGIDFSGIYSSTSGSPSQQGIWYRRSTGASLIVYSVRSGWSNSNYRTVTFPETITDETLLNWLQENATLISGSIDIEKTFEEEIEEMLVNGDEYYEDEGKQFYSVHKWIVIWNSSLSSAPVTISAMNNHPTLWIHAYIKVIDTVGNEYYYTMAIEPDQGENSIEVDYFVWHFEVEGIRWSEDGI